MTNKEIVNRNIGLSFDFLKQIVRNPAILESIKNNSVIEFLQKDYPEKESVNKSNPDHYFKIKREFEAV